MKKQNEAGNKKLNAATLEEGTTPAAEAATETKKVSGPVINVLSAVYGIGDKTVQMASFKPGQKLTNKMAGSDPAPKEKKSATIKIEILKEGQEPIVVEKTFVEGEKLIFEELAK